MAYLGCGTSSNKIAWGVFTLLLLLAAVLLGVGLGKTIPCSRQLMSCIHNNRQYQQDPAVCTAPYRQCARPYIIIAGLGAVAVFIALSIVCCMCCCSKPPHKVTQPATGQPYGQMTGVQMTQSPYPVMGSAAMGPPGQQQQQYGSPYGGGGGYGNSTSSSGRYGYQQQQQQAGAFGSPAPGQFVHGPPQYTV